MSNINQVILSGRLSRDADVKVLPTGTPVTEFSLGVNDYQGKGKNERVNWIECIMFNKEKITNYLKKGMKITIVGKLRQERWEKDGIKRYKLKVIVNELEFPDRQSGSYTNNNGSNYNDNSDDVPPDINDMPF